MGREERESAGATWDPLLLGLVPWDTSQLLHHTTTPDEYHFCECWGNTPQRLPALRHRAWCHPTIIPPISGSVWLPALCPGDCKQGTVSRVLVQRAQDTPPAPGRCCARGGMPLSRVPVGARRPGRAIASQEPAGAGAARRPGRVPSSVRSRQPGQHVPSGRAHAAGRGEACRGTARAACTVPRLSPPRAAGTARDTGCCGGVRLQLRAPAELSQAWDNKEHSGL